MASFDKLPTRKYRARIRREGIRKTKTFTSKKNAQAWAAKIEAQIELGIASHYLGNPELRTVEDLLDRYEKEITPRKKTWRGEGYRIDVLKRSIGSTHLARLEAAVVLDHIDRRLKPVQKDVDPVKPNTLKKELDLLSHALDTGVALWGLSIPDNPVKVARRILSTTQSLKIRDARERRLTKKEEKSLKAQDKRLADFIDFAIDTCMRLGEIIAMRPEHLSKGLLSIPDTKTGEPRVIPLTARAAKIFDKYKGSMYPSVKAAQGSFRVYREKVGIKDLRIHDLRHEGTSRLFEKGLAIQEVAAITGHKNWTSLKRYTHVDPKNLKKKI